MLGREILEVDRPGAVGLELRVRCEAPGEGKQEGERRGERRRREAHAWSATYAGGGRHVKPPRTAAETRKRAARSRETPEDGEPEAVVQQQAPERQGLEHPHLDLDERQRAEQTRDVRGLRT